MPAVCNGLVRFVRGYLITVAQMLGSMLIGAVFAVFGWFLGTWFISLGMPAEPNAAALQLQTYVGIFMAGAFFGCGTLIIPITFWTDRR